MSKVARIKFSCFVETGFVKPEFLHTVKEIDIKYFDDIDEEQFKKELSTDRCECIILDYCATHELLFCSFISVEFIEPEYESCIVEGYRPL